VLAFSASIGPDYALPMRQKLLRAFVALATFAVVWLVASPARAAGAPVCDPRGAIVFAPPPQQQDPELSLDVVLNDDDCTKSPLESKNVVPNRAPVPHAAFATPDLAVTTTNACILHGFAARIPVPAAAAAPARPGFTDTIERPPRA
jgi:hypothetical protein